MVSYAIPGMKKASADKVTALLQDRLDSLSDHTGQLEQFHWFVRAHLERPDGSLRTAGAATERTAARHVSG